MAKVLVTSHINIICECRCIPVLSEMFYVLLHASFDIIWGCNQGNCAIELDSNFTVHSPLCSATCSFFIDDILSVHLLQ